MGISNFTLLLNQTSTVSTFDSILIDAQSLLYVAISYTMKEKENDILSDICKIVLSEIGCILNELFQTNAYEDDVTIVISFDGEGVPMKWPTQQKRRELFTNGKNLYRVALFGNNIISKKVLECINSSLLDFCKFKENFMRLTNIPNRLQFILSGSNIEGEGEHKLFHISKNIKCKKPVIVSVDNDIFILSFKHFSEFEHIQIKRKQNIYYDLRKEHLLFDYDLLVNASLLLGNDFIPAIISITINNFNCIQDALFNFPGGDLADLFSFLLNYLLEKNKLRYEQVPFIDFNLMIDFWKTCFWVLDYYSSRHFPQKHMTNTLFDSFDRNVIISALLDIDYSKSVCEEAKKQYDIIISQPKNSLTQVFQLDQLKEVKRFLITNLEKNAPCQVIKINRKKT